MSLCLSIPIIFAAKFDLKTIFNELSRVKHKSYQIGLQLGIPNFKLKDFKKEDEPLAEAIEYWLNGNVEGVLLSWKSVVEALSSDCVGEHGLAKEIIAKYCQQDDICVKEKG